MDPYTQQPRPQTYFPQQSRGFQPFSQPPQQPPYAQRAHPPASSFAPRYQSQPQPPPPQQQQRAAQFYRQPQPHAPPQRYVPPAPVHSQPQPPHVPSQTFQPFQQPRAQGFAYAPSSSYLQARPGPVVSPPRANSQSPDKTRRPLPEPAAAIPGATRPRPVSMSSIPAMGFGAQIQTQGPIYAAHATAAYAPPLMPTSAASGSQHPSFTQLQQPQAAPRPLHQPQPQAIPRIQAHQPSTPPRQPYPPSLTPHSSISPGKRSQTLPNSNTTESPTSKRPLPAPPGRATPPISTPSLSGVSPTVSTSSSPRRTLPFSPTQPPSVEEGINSKRNTFSLPPKRSSTLPTSANVSSNKVVPNDTMDSKLSSERQVTRPQTSVANSPTSRPSPSVPFDAQTSMPSQPTTSFARPPQKQQTQSLAFRLAALSLQEEQFSKRSSSRIPTSENATRTQVRSSHVRYPVDLDDAPPSSTIRRLSFDSNASTGSMTPSLPMINVPGDENDDDDDDSGDDGELPSSAGPVISRTVPPLINVSAANAPEAPAISISEPPAINVSEPAINVSGPPAINVSEAPSISISEPPQAPSITFSEATPTITVSELPETSNTMLSSSIPDIIVADLEGTLETSVDASAQRKKGLICYGCGKGIMGRIVSAMGGRWHPACFKCSVCSELLEHVSSYEHNGRPYCHLDYHEKFAPQCYHCRTPIVDERFITLDDPALGKRTYHEQHFFCAECGDPFLAPTIPGKDQPETEVVAQDDDVGFTVYKGHPYCEACHVRLRYPKCKRCKKSIRDGMQAVEALGGKWCWECFLCAGCERPFQDPAFFQRDNKPYCEPCFSLIIKNEI